MAGNFIEILNPGYSTLWTRDLLYTPGSGEAATLNPFDPNSARPLVEGEFLQHSAADGKRVTRGGNNVMAVSGTPDNEAADPSFLYFQEKGRFDAQATKRTHIIMGPAGFEFRTKLCSTLTLGGLAVNDAVSVWDWDGDAGAFGLVRRVLAKHSGGSQWVIGRVTRIFGTNDIGVLFMPGSAA